MPRDNKPAIPKTSQPKSSEPQPRQQDKTPEAPHHDTLAGTGMDQEPTR
jgi:hypothetical protein